MEENIHIRYTVKVDRGSKVLLSTNTYAEAQNYALELSTTVGNKRKSYEVWFDTIEHKELRICIKNGKVDVKGMSLFGKGWP